MPKRINGIFSQLMIELNPRDQHGMTPFHYACKNGQLDMVSKYYYFFCIKMNRIVICICFGTCITLFSNVVL